MEKVENPGDSIVQVEGLGREGGGHGGEGVGCWRCLAGMVGDGMVDLKLPPVPAGRLSNLCLTN